MIKCRTDMQQGLTHNYTKKICRIFICFV